MSFDAYAPFLVSQLRTQIALCASWTTAVGAGNEAARIHFPAADFWGDNETADPLPAIVIVRTAAGRAMWTPGTLGLIKGTLEMDIYASAISGVNTYTVGRLEALAETLHGELMIQTSGIPFIDMDQGMATEPTPYVAATDTLAAPAAYRAIRVSLPYGLHS